MPTRRPDDELVPVPRPSEVSLGAPAPWEALPAAQRRGLSLAHVLDALGRAGHRGPVPRWEPPRGGRATVHDGPSPDGPAFTSAVLVPLFEEEGETRVVLTRRSAELRSHRGQVSFPGGRIDPGEDAPTAARREAFEEVGLPPAAVEVVGWLHPLFTMSAGSFISPVVGVLSGRPTLVANPAEVARVFDVALADLVADGVFHEERWTHEPGRPPPGPDGRRPVWFFEIDGETVWGATARVLVQLLSLVLELPFEPA
jgi:8-oxo-dGTP pyrophosphatase MutT (NUDIX family)